MVFAMNKFRELRKEEMSRVEGGTWMEFLDYMTWGLSCGFAGYGPNGFTSGGTPTAKNKYVPGGP